MAPVIAARVARHQCDRAAGGQGRRDRRQEADRAQHARWWRERAHLGGADLLTIGRHGSWADGSNALLGYIRDVDRWARNPMYKAGL